MCAKWWVSLGKNRVEWRPERAKEGGSSWPGRGGIQGLMTSLTNQSSAWVSDVEGPDRLRHGGIGTRHLGGSWV